MSSSAHRRATGQSVPIPSPGARLCHGPVFYLFVVAWAALAATEALGIRIRDGLLEGTFVFLLAATTLVNLARRLPVQNVIVVGTGIMLLALVIEWVGVTSGIPFGARTYTDRLGMKLFGLLPWTVPLLWAGLLINARGVARLIFRPWRKTSFYGFWVMGLTCFLAATFAFVLEPFAGQQKQYWLWENRLTVLAWHGAPWVSFLGWWASSLIILLFVSPWLINKHPIAQPTDFYPLAIWILLLISLAAAHAAAARWIACALAVAIGGLTAVCSLRGAHR